MKTPEALGDSSVIIALGIIPFQGRRGWHYRNQVSSPLLHEQGRQSNFGFSTDGCAG